MTDPLGPFDWSTIHEQYDQKCDRCERFDPDSPHLLWFGLDRPRSDRELYYRLIANFSLQNRAIQEDLTGLYECLLYWKYYSQGGICPRNISYLGNRGSELRSQSDESICEAFALMPETLVRCAPVVLALVKRLSKLELPCAGGCNLPTQTTLLHFLYPDIVPIFDKQVLKAVGVDGKLNHSFKTFERYLPFSWSLADRYQARMSQGDETPLRRIDMALWVHRGMHGPVSSARRAGTA